MKKVLFFINTLGTGGAEHVLVDIANKLDSKKFDITIKTIYDINVYKNEINDNIKVESYYHSKKNKLIDKVFKKILYLKIKKYSSDKLYKMMIKNKYDIEIAFLEGLPTKIISGSDNVKSKKIAWVHCDFEINKDSDFFFNSEEEQLQTYKKFDEIYCVSNKAKESFVKRFFIDKNIYTLYNIVDKNKILKKAQEKVELSNDFNIITVGRLTKQKGFIRLIESYANIINKLNVKTHLYIIGDGEEKEAIEKKIKERKMEPFVSLLGNQSNPYKYMKNCDLYVCSSYSEGYPLTIVEALTLHLPVFATNCSDFTQMLDNGNFGLIVENNEKSIEEGLVKIINNSKILKKYKNNIVNNYIDNDKNIKRIENQILN